MKKHLLLLLCFWAMGASAQKIERLKTVNTNAYTEYAPTLSANGQTMVFQSDNNPYKAWFLYESTRLKNGGWTKPEPIRVINTFGQNPSEINNFQTDFIATPCLSANGKLLLFSATFRGGAGGRDIYYSQKIHGRWTRPRSVGNKINSKGNDDCPALSADGHNLYFARPLPQKKQGQRCYKLFVSRKNKHGRWQKAEALPYPVNTGCEKCPRIMKDNATLLFSSIREGGKGGFDLYKAVLDIQGKDWVELKAMEFANTPGSEGFASITAPENALYFTAKGKRSDDIFRVKKMPDYMKLKQNIRVKGIVTDAKTRRPLTVSILVKLLRGEAKAIAGKRASRKGFSLLLRQGYKYELTMNAYGYETVSKEADLTNWSKAVYDMGKIALKRHQPLIAKATKPVKHKPTHAVGAALLVDINTGEVISEADEKQALAHATKQKPVTHKPENLQPLESLKMHKKLIFSHLLFGYNSAKLDQKILGYLQTIAQLLKKETTLKLEISAHTDDHGQHNANIKLSEERANAVRNYLIKEGIEKQRLSAKGYGETRPIVPNTNAANRERNRRVELRVK